MMQYQPQYQQTSNGYWQYQPQLQAQPEINCKYVDDFNAITANDVSMSAPTLFAKRDMTELQMRTWMPNGTIGITSYKAILDNKDNQTSILSQDSQNSLYDEITKKFDAIMERFDLLEKPKSKTTVKKEVENE